MTSRSSRVFIRKAINHDPAITYINTGVQQPGKPAMGAWVSYGLGSPNKDLPAYIVMISRGPGGKQALYERLWGAGFLSVATSRRQASQWSRAGTLPQKSGGSRSPDATPNVGRHFPHQCRTFQ